MTNDQQVIKMTDTVPEDVTAADCQMYFPTITAARVIQVYDADTITIACRCAGQDGLFKLSVRLAGIDTPEMRSHDPKLKALANVARDALRERILGKLVRIDVKRIKEKFGRTLADVYLDNVNINEWLIAEGYANRYDGGTKAEFTHKRKKTDNE
jgi:endonuclease YncB( thermonuclease family)